MGRELLSVALGLKLELSSVKNVKFLSILDPGGAPVNVSIHNVTRTGNEAGARIDFTRDGVPVAKMSFVCRIAGQV